MRDLAPRLDELLHLLARLEQRFGGGHRGGRGCGVPRRADAVGVLLGATTYGIVQRIGQGFAVFG